MYLTNLYIETRIRGLRRTVGWYGYVLECIDGKGIPHTATAYEQVSGVTPNQLALTAFCAALDRLKDNTEVIVYTESQYLKECYTRNLKDWEANGWRLANGEPVKNLELWQQAERKSRYKAVAFADTSQHSYKQVMQYELKERSTGHVF